MGTYQELKKLWKKLGIKGQVRNYSSKPLWVVEMDKGKAVAHLLPPMTKSPTKIDADGFRRVDEKPIEGHKSWWKISDGSITDVFDDGDKIKTYSIIKRVPVADSEFTEDKIIYDRSENWAVPVKLVTDAKRNKKKKITKYLVTEVGWIDPSTALNMTCVGEIDNARPVFPSSGKPYIRTRRDREIFNNLEVKG